MSSFADQFVSPSVDADVRSAIDKLLELVVDGTEGTSDPSFDFDIDRYRTSNVHELIDVDDGSSGEDTDEEFHKIMQRHRQNHKRQLADSGIGGASDDDEEAEEMRRLNMERMKRDYERKAAKRGTDAQSTTSHASSRHSIKFNARDKDLWELPPIELLQITVDEKVELRRLGVVTSVVDTLVVIKADVNGPSALDDDSVLFTAARHSLGRVFEIFGPVSQPFYSVRFNTVDEIEEAKLAKDDIVYYAPLEKELTNHVEKHIDNAVDDAGDECVEFSDDEAERSFRTARGGQANRVVDGQRGGGGRGRKRHHNKSQQVQHNNQQGGDQSRGGYRGRGRGGNRGGFFGRGGCPTPPPPHYMQMMWHQQHSYGGPPMYPPAPYGPGGSNGQYYNGPPHPYAQPPPGFAPYGPGPYWPSNAPGAPTEESVKQSTDVNGQKGDEKKGDDGT